MFTTQPNLVTRFSVHSSLHNNCYHISTLVKFDLSIEYSPPYKRLMWNYKQANSLFIQCAINEFNWENVFSNIDIDKKS